MLLDLDNIYNIDCVEGLHLIEDESIALIVTSPPYFAGKNYNEGGSYFADDLMSEWHKYIDWLSTIFIKCTRVLIPSGKLAINIDDKHTSLKNLGKNVCLPTHAMLTHNLLPYLDYKEMLLWKKIRASHATGGSRRMLGSYGRFGSPGEIPIVQEVEYILLFRKAGRRAVNNELRIESMLSSEEFKSWGMQIWNIQPERILRKLHPAPFPVEIPERLMRLTTFVDDIVLDPFAGIGTTGVACVKTGRNFIGFELEELFCDIGNKRIEDEKERLISNDVGT